MYTAHRNLHPERKKTEGNPCEGSMVFCLSTKKSYPIVRVDRNVSMEVVKIYVKTDEGIERWLLDDFWNEFTTRQNNLKQTL